MHVQGNDDGVGFGVEGTSQNNAGIIGSSTGGKGVVATSETDIGGLRLEQEFCRFDCL